MINSEERIKFISEKLFTYVARIETLNKCGLFDAATLYEVFSVELCKLWFGQVFHNLNVEKANVPYVDLVSEDGKIYVQVGTTTEIRSKVKNTLEKIRDNKSHGNLNIEKLYFVMLDSNVLSKPIDFTGDNKIGNIEFHSNINLITIREIMEKTKSDLSFQKELYQALREDNKVKQVIDEYFLPAVHMSKILIEKNINNLINGEYEIDRKEIIKSIMKQGHQFISIQGDAGTGKSALCKKILKDKKYVLYTRAEKFFNVNSIDDVWTFNVDIVLKYLSGEEIYFFIDALEFIADGRKSVHELLQQLYITCQKYPNAHVITSCRTCDSSAFFTLDSIYNINKYTVELLNEEEIIKIALKYKVVEKLLESKKYVPLLSLPFYLNIIVGKISNPNKIAEVHSFREYIWNYVICLNDNTIPSSLNSSDIRKTIEKIVFDRAKDFSVGVDCDEFDDEIIKLLISKDIVTYCGENSVRLKYDIFEDICFEHYIDIMYKSCKGRYSDFYSCLENLGRCCYRRYQIWVENKLLSKNNREAFLYKLLRSNEIPDKWRENTLLGIIKSNFCEEFFDEYEDDIKCGQLPIFIKLTNLFAFEARIQRLGRKTSYTILNPVGLGRCELIKIIYENNLYHNSDLKNDITKLCSDYADTLSLDASTANAVCKIIESYIESEMNGEDFDSPDSEIINHYLDILYRMATYSKDWVANFWNKVILNYNSIESYDYGIEDNILKYTLEKGSYKLAINMPEELCLIADTYWLKPKKDNDAYLYSYADPLVRNNLLSRHLDEYDREYTTTVENNFVKFLCMLNVKYALKWVIKLTNTYAELYSATFTEAVDNAQIYFPDSDKRKSFICTPEFWTAGMIEGHVPNLIGDMLYEITTRFLEYPKKPEEQELHINDLRLIRDYVLDEANNVMMLSVLASIGFKFKEELPGYIAEFATSIDLLMTDNIKIAIISPNENIEKLEDMTFMQAGIPKVPSRYPRKIGYNFSLHRYIIDMQLYGNDLLIQKAEGIIDYLYSKVPNDAVNAEKYLQIQKIDVRNSKFYRVDSQNLLLVPKVSGEAEKVVKRNEENPYSIAEKEYVKIIERFKGKYNNNSLTAEYCLEEIDKLESLIKLICLPQLQQIKIYIIVRGLSLENISSTQRSKFCYIWLRDIDTIFEKNSFYYDYPLSQFLFEQYDKNISDATRNHMKKIILALVMYNGSSMNILKIKQTLEAYLNKNKILAKSVFNTIVELAKVRKKEIAWRIYIAPKVNDVSISQNIAHYERREEEVINRYLITGEGFDYSDWSIELYDVETLTYIVNSGLSFEDKDFCSVMEKILGSLIKSLAVGDDNNHLETMSRIRIERFIGSEIANKSDIIYILNILFNDIDLKNARYRLYDFYDNISRPLFIQYCDAFNAPKIRRQCEEKIKEIEKKVLCYKDNNTRCKLTSMLFLNIGHYLPNDFSELPAGYSYADKMFLNDIWSKYGLYHYDKFLRIIYEMNIEKLLPEVILPLNRCTQQIDSNNLRYIIEQRNLTFIVNQIITIAFLEFNDAIKSDEELTSAYEEVLEKFKEIGVKEAAVLLDEFRTH